MAIGRERLQGDRTVAELINARRGTGRSQSPVLWLVSLTFLALRSLAVCAYQVVSHRAVQALHDAETEASRISPGWRLEEIEAARATPLRNSAHCLADTADLLPPGWRSLMGKPADDDLKLGGAIAAHAPGKCLTAETIGPMRKAVNAVTPAVVHARALANQPEGRYRIVWEPDVFSTRLPHIEKLRDVATLLIYDALLWLDDRDIDEALNSCLAVLNAGRSIGDEPLLVSQLARTRIVDNVCRLTEHVLVHGEPSDAALAELGRVLDREQAEPRLWWALRGERAAFDCFFACAEDGEFTAEELRKITGQPGFSPTGLTGPSLVPGGATIARAAVLRYLSKAVEIAKLPPEQQLGALTKLEATVKHLPMMTGPFVPALGQAFTAFHRVAARLVCSSAALAAERYRLARGEWPSSLDRLVPALLPHLPTSPIDGKDLRYRPVADGVTISPVDNGDAEHQNMGFRLWNAPVRQRSAKRAD
jgi:hypothetical protein